MRLLHSYGVIGFIGDANRSYHDHQMDWNLYNLVHGASGQKGRVRHYKFPDLFPFEDEMLRKGEDPLIWEYKRKKAAQEMMDDG